MFTNSRVVEGTTVHLNPLLKNQILSLIKRTTVDKVDKLYQFNDKGFILSTPFQSFFYLLNFLNMEFNLDLPYRHTWSRLFGCCFWTSQIYFLSNLFIQILMCKLTFSKIVYVSKEPLLHSLLWKITGSSTSKMYKLHRNEKEDQRKNTQNLM